MTFSFLFLCVWCVHVDGADSVTTPPFVLPLVPLIGYRPLEVVGLSIRSGSLVTFHFLLIQFFRCYFILNICWQRRLRYATWTRLWSGRYRHGLLVWCQTVPKHIFWVPSRHILLDYQGSCLRGKPGMWPFYWFPHVWYYLFYMGANPGCLASGNNVGLRIKYCGKKNLCSGTWWVVVTDVLHQLAAFIFRVESKKRAYQVTQLNIQKTWICISQQVGNEKKIFTDI